MLPVSDVLPALETALAAGNAVLVAPPGAGKTSLAPLHLLQAPWLQGGIVMLEPRRLAARAAAMRMSALLGEAVGGVVGYRTRLDSAVSAATRIEVVTEGLLVRRLQSDPGLHGTGLVILDEVHERALQADLALALCLDLQRQLRPELRLLAMSATADGARLSALMDAPVIESAGRLFPVTIQHAARDIAQPRDLADALAAAVRAALAAHEGDVLGFPAGDGRDPPGAGGAGWMRRAGAAAAWRPAAGRAVACTLTPAAGRRVVLATSIAETSLTVPGVRIVVDGGWRRAPRLDSATGLTRLTTLRISRAAPDQRAGRAGREAPGVAIRLWSETLHRGLAVFDRPEILEAELSGLVLDCAAWGTPPEALPFPDPPPAGALAAGRALLTDLGALADGETGAVVTEAGRRMVQLGAHPRLAAMMLAARMTRASGRWRPIWRRCWRSATRCVAVIRRRTWRCGWTRWPGGAMRMARRWRASAGRRRSIGGGSGRMRRPPAIRRRCWRRRFRTGSRSGAARSGHSGCRAAAGRNCRPPTRWRARACWRWGRSI